MIDHKMAIRAMRVIIPRWRAKALFQLIDLCKASEINLPKTGGIARKAIRANGPRSVLPEQSKPIPTPSHEPRAKCKPVAPIIIWRINIILAGNIFFFTRMIVIKK